MTRTISEYSRISIHTDKLVSGSAVVITPLPSECLSGVYSVLYCIKVLLMRNKLKNTSLIYSGICVKNERYMLAVLRRLYGVA